jgi:AcrR family transcriptional regulator
MSGERRPYRKKRRAALEAATRLRIAESAVELHGSIGPARTSVAAVAARAGVRRSTVYRHFPDEAALFEACSAHWAAANPMPDPDEWAAVGDPAARLRRALDELYAFYARTERMVDNLLRDEAHVPVLAGLLDGYRGYLAGAARVLLRGRGLRAARRRRCAAAIGHALAFATWRSLVREQGLAHEDAVALMAGLAEDAAGGRRPTRPA